MKILAQGKKRIHVELTPLELQLLRHGIARERNQRNRVWSKVEPRFPEELLYHLHMKDTCQQLLEEIDKGVLQYKKWGVLE